jgi:hypothetical protein
MGFEMNGSLFTYGGDQRGFLERISTQEYQGRFEKGWEAYISQCAKEVKFVDQVLATGGRGQGETVNIPADYGSKSHIFRDQQLTLLEKKTILLDLDETLIHTEAYKDNKVYDIVIDMAENGDRPDVRTFTRNNS